MPAGGSPVPANDPGARPPSASPPGASPPGAGPPGARPPGAGPARAEPDWARLREAADQVAARAYAPYSGLTVGAAGLCEDGVVITGCNVENSSYGLTLCAECGLVSALLAGGHGRLLAVSVTAGDSRPLTPCGRCRQLLMEHGGPELLLDAGPAAPPHRLAQLLPSAFDHTELVERRATAPSNGTGMAEGGG